MVAAMPLLLALMGSLASAQVDCLTNSSDPSCKSYTMPADMVKTDLDALCKQMPYMPGCSIYKSCQDMGKTDEWCQPLSLLADVCAKDMPSMRDCSHYVSMCGQPANATSPRAVPDECKTQPMVDSLPTTKEASNLVIDICTEMDMAGCERCPKPAPGAYAADCDTIGTYAILCKSMPDMSQCATWKTMCSPTSPTDPQLNFDQSQYCAAGQGDPEMDPPAMRMFFHLGYADYVLFQTWVPRNMGQYVGTWFALFFLTLIYQFISTYRASLDIQWAEVNAAAVAAAASSIVTNAADGGHRADSPDIVKGLSPLSSDRESLRGSTRERTPMALVDEAGRPTSILRCWVDQWRQPWTTTEVQQNVIRFFLTAVESTLGYSLMLVTMTFNVPLFFAVIAGLAVGAVVFARQKTMVVRTGGPNANANTSGCAGCG
ncbi:hypothetical protein DFQ26_008123 [Actinomortierella ambigua]|nr:hypothetical protein DFQ26_008123 [Actinomortierella ambigua]